MIAWGLSKVERWVLLQQYKFRVWRFYYRTTPHVTIILRCKNVHTGRYVCNNVVRRGKRSNQHSTRHALPSKLRRQAGHERSTSSNTRKSTPSQDSRAQACAPRCPRIANPSRLWHHGPSQQHVCENRKKRARVTCATVHMG